MLAAEDNEQVVIAAKMEMQTTLSALMPKGQPKYTAMREYPMLAALINERGQQTMHKVVLALIKDFCASLNVVRNMSKIQMIEAAGFLLEECGNFRLEDYVIMFALAKRGDLVKILDRMDIQIIGQMIDEYWERRNSAANTEMYTKPISIAPADAKYVEPAKVFEAIRNVAQEIIQQTKDGGQTDQDAADEETRRQQMIIRRRAQWENTIDQLDKTETP